MPWQAFKDLTAILAFLNRAASRKQIPITNFDSSFLFASLLWGSIGVGYWIYGKKQREMMPMIGGAAMVGVSYLVSSWLLMSIISLALMIAVYQLLKRGH